MTRFPMRSTCHVPSLKKFSLMQFHRGPVFPTWLPHHVTYNIIIIKTFYMSSRTNGENFVSIRQAVAEKNTKVLCGQTDTPNATPSSGDSNKYHQPPPTF